MAAAARCQRQRDRDREAAARAWRCSSQGAAVRLRRSPRRSTGRARRRHRSRCGRRRAAGTAGPARRPAAGSRTSPPFSTTSRAAPSPAVVVTADPAAVAVVGDGVVDHVVDHAAQQRLAALDPDAVADALACCTVRFLAVIASSRAARAADTTQSSGSTAWPGSAPCWARASTSSPPAAGRPCRARRGPGRPARSSAGGTGPGLATATSTDARIVASGVRSSWEALATNRRCAANAPPGVPAARRSCRRGPSARRRGPSTASRSCRLSAEIRRVLAVITRSGRSTRPATTQPAATDTTAITPSAIAEPSRYWCDVPACDLYWPRSAPLSRCVRRLAEVERPHAVGDCQQHDGGQHEQNAVQGGQTHPHSAARPEPHRHLPIQATAPARHGDSRLSMPRRALQRHYGRRPARVMAVAVQPPPWKQPSKSPGCASGSAACRRWTG